MILGLLINSVILSLVISFATKTKKKLKFMEVQCLLLIEIAKRDGVNAETLKKLLYTMPDI